MSLHAFSVGWYRGNWWWEIEPHIPIDYDDLSVTSVHVLPHKQNQVYLIINQRR